MEAPDGKKHKFESCFNAQSINCHEFFLLLGNGNTLSSSVLQIPGSSNFPRPPPAMTLNRRDGKRKTRNTSIYHAPYQVDCCHMTVEQIIRRSLANKLQAANVARKSSQSLMNSNWIISALTIFYTI